MIRLKLFDCLVWLIYHNDTGAVVSGKNVLVNKQKVSKPDCRLSIKDYSLIKWSHNVHTDQNAFRGTKQNPEDQNESYH